MKNLTKKQWVIVAVVIALIGGGVAYKTKHHRRTIMSSAFENYVRTGEPLDESSRLQTALGLKPSASYDEIWEALRDEPVGAARLCPDSRSRSSVFLHVYEFTPGLLGRYRPSSKAITPLAVNGMPVTVTKDGFYGYPGVPRGATYIEISALPNPAAPGGKVIVEWRQEDFRGFPGFPLCSAIPFAVPVALKTGETIRIPIERTD